MLDVEALFMFSVSCIDGFSVYLPEYFQFLENHPNVPVNLTSFKMNKLGIFHFYEEHPLDTNESLEEISTMHCTAVQTVV